MNARKFLFKKNLQSMFGKPKRKTIIKIIACLFLIVTIFRFLFDDNISNSNVKYLTDINLINDALQRAKSTEVDLDNKYQFTAIVLHWRSLSRVQQSVQSFINSKCFKEIIVWNNNPEIKLAHNQILPINNSSTLIYIINSNENLKDQAKYLACTTAQTLVCFYSDDDWDTSRYMKTLIASFRSDPHVLHLATNEVTYYNNMLWTFMDSQIDLHTGFARIGCGSVFLREHAERHLQLLTTHLQSNQEILAYSDVFFSMWLNDIPTQMVVDLRTVPTNANEMDIPFSDTGDFGSFLHTSSVLAIRKLEYSLRLNQSTTSVAFPRQQKRRFPYCVRSSSLNDDFIFFSNVLPVDIEHIPFDITRDADRGTYRNVPAGPNYTHFASFNTMKAVDNDGKTCWRPLGMVKKGDFFAIDFLRLQSDMTFTLVIGHTLKLQKSLDLRVSFDGVLWLSHQSLQSTFVEDNVSSTLNLRRLIVESRKFSSTLQTFRYIAFNATYNFVEAFQVCDIQIIKKA